MSEIKALNKRVTELDERLRIVEASSSSTLATMAHLTKSIDGFIERLDRREDKEDARFNKFQDSISYLQKVAYIGIGGLAIIQFLIVNNIIGVK